MKKVSFGIGTGIALRIVCLMLAGMLMVAVAVLKIAERNIGLQQIESATVLVNGLACAADFLAPDLAPQRVETGDFSLLLNSYVRTGSFDYIALVKHDGTVVAEGTGSGRAPSALAVEAQSERLAMKPVYTFTGSGCLLFFGEDTRLVAVRPLFIRGHKWGVIYAKSMLTDLREDMSRLYNLTFVYVAFDAILLFFFGYVLLSRKIVQPIKRLTTLIDATGSDAIEPFAAHEEANEIGRLYHAVEHMGNRLREQKRRIGEYITSLEKTNHELKKVQEEVIRSEKLASVGRLAAGISHEIGNPLAAIIGYVELLLQGTFTKHEQRDFLKRMASELQRINMIIKDLLDFSRPSASQIGGVPVNEVVEGSLSLLAHQKLMRYVNVSVDLDPDIPLVRADAQQLKQVLVNILVNAAAAMPIGGDLKVSSWLKKTAEQDETKEWVVVDIQDTGTGIAPGDLSKIFDPFFTTKPRGEGTGLGLPISLRIMESFCGRIEVKSAVGEGTRISLMFEVWTGS